MKRLAIVLFMAASPAMAQDVYGPPSPGVEEASLPEAPAFDEEKWRSDTRSAWGRFWISQGLAATDIGLTCYMLAQRHRDGSKRFREGNPIYGKNASCGRIVAIRGGISVLQYLLFRNAVRRDPASAKRAAMWGIAIQGVPVGFNAWQLSK